MCVLVAFFGQWSGNTIFSYFPYLGFEMAHIAEETRFILSGVQAVLQLFIGVLGARSADRFGRRPMVVWGTVGLSMCMVITTIGMWLGRETVPDGWHLHDVSAWGAYLVIIGQYLYQFVFAMCWTPVQVLYPVEVRYCVIRRPHISHIETTLTLDDTLVFNNLHASKRNRRFQSLHLRFHRYRRRCRSQRRRNITLQILFDFHLLESDRGRSFILVHGGNKGAHVRRAGSGF